MSTLDVDFRAAFQPLDRRAEPLSRQVILDWLRGLTLTLEELSPAIVFSPDHYVRNLLHQGPSYHALVLCWRNGQRSPIHNHRGSACGVKVLQGVATETTFKRAPNGMIIPDRTRDWEEGTLCYSEDEDMHQISNVQALGADLITLHLYSPPLLQMDIFPFGGSISQLYHEPIHEPFTHGAGI